MSVRSKGEGDSVVLDLGSKGFGNGVSIAGSLDEHEVEKASTGLDFDSLGNFWRGIESEPSVMAEIAWPSLVLLVSLANGWGVEGGLGDGSLSPVTRYTTEILQKYGEPDLNLHANLVSLIKLYDITYQVDGQKKNIIFVDK